MAGLDLNVFVKQTWDLTLLTGETINVMKPTQELMIRLFNLQKDPLLNGNVKEDDFGKLMELMTSLTMDILNYNKNDKKFTKKDINTMFTFDMLMEIIESYKNFATGVMSNPNS